MPVERRNTSQQALAVVIGLVVLALVLGGMWMLLRAASGGDSPTTWKLGDDVFDAGQAERLSAQIQEGGPVLFSDVAGRGQRRPIVVNHFGDDATIRWVAFTASVPGSPANCFLLWNAEQEVFEERAVSDDAAHDEGELCSDDRYPPNGLGLEQFPWKIDEDGNLIIDLRPPQENPSTDVDEDSTASD